MSVNKNVHDVEVALGIATGEYEEEQTKIKPLTPEWFKAKAAEFASDEDKAKEMYSDFAAKYGPSVLLSKSGEELLKLLFLNGDCNDLCHELEYVKLNNEFFGSVKGGSAFKYPMFYDKDNGSWVCGSKKNPKYLTLTEAVAIGTEVRDKLIQCVNKIKDVESTLNTVEDYLNLYTELYTIMPSYIGGLWVMKYFHMLYPTLFPTFYNEDWQKRVLDTLNIVPSDAAYARMGQIMIFIRQCEISTVAFNKVFHKYAKGVVLADEEDQPIDADENEDIRVKGATNVILYGVPGAGKSHTIKSEYCSDESCMERLVFHPDYTYSDFVGQILPKLDDDGNVTYVFNPGPFTKIVRKAHTNPEEMFYLVIEEINRGNAPAIFGDIFQLLDRDENGSSEYAITNADIATAVYGSENHKVKIPSNLTILCTMNTSDQNVFTLDTAFQRRWNMRLIQNKFGSEENERKFAETKILDTDVTWEKFFTEINNIILKKNVRMTSSEDKRLGTHFVKPSDLEYVEGNIRQNSMFAEKVLKYLWDDAFKFNKDEIFDLSKVDSLEKVIESFVGAQGNARFTSIFKQNIYDAIIAKKS